MKRVIVVGAGFTGLSVGYYLSEKGYQVTVLEAESEPGGLAGTFSISGTRLEKYYHHWFSSDKDIFDLIKSMNKEDSLVVKNTSTGVFYTNRVYKLSTPSDILRFRLLTALGKCRLIILILYVRLVRNWRRLENKTASDWLKFIGGKEVYRVIWQPLLRGKFGSYETSVSAVWIWNKLKLRGSSRGPTGRERLFYYKGGFAALIADIEGEIIRNNGQIHTGCKVTDLVVRDGKISGVYVDEKYFNADYVILTPALPIIESLVRPYVNPAFVSKIQKIKYLSNICVVLESTKSLTETYWLNINDPSFPFIAVIEHTNFEDKSTYNNRHIIYLSKYLLPEDPLMFMTSEEVIDYALQNMKKLFPNFDYKSIVGSHVWRSNHSQPIVDCAYVENLPDFKTEIAGLLINTMAQIYPEDRGTNYAVRQGKKMADLVANGEL